MRQFKTAIQSAEGVAESACLALTWLNLPSISYPGFQRPLRVLFHPGLFYDAPSVLHLFKQTIPDGRESAMQH